MAEATRRFSDRVDDYIRYRPGYPEELIHTLLTETKTSGDATVADIGSGTGIFTRLLLDAGISVYAVEPNSEMRTAAEELLSDRPGYTSVGAPAEATGLEEDSVDLITAAQAFHWFNNETTRVEFGRILKADGHLALIWNRRRIAKAFQLDYENLLRCHAPEYNAVNHMNLDDDEIGVFFARGSMKKFSFEYSQEFDFAGLLGRVKSSSYCPVEGSDAFSKLHDDLQILYEEHQLRGKIDFEYDSNLYLGRIQR